MKIEGLTSKERMESVLQQLDTQSTKFPGMTYEQGIEIALQWAIGEITEKEFLENV